MSFVAFATGFEEAGATNSTTDLTGNHTIVFSGGGQRRSALPKFGTRSFDSSASFTTTGAATAAASPDFDLADGQDHTVSIYMRQNTFGGSPRLISNGVFEMLYSGTGLIVFSVETDSGTVTLTSTSTALGAAQQHCLVTFDAAGGTIRLGFEGNIEDTAAWDGTFAGTAGDLVICGDGGLFVDDPTLIQGWAFTKSNTTYTVPTQPMIDEYNDNAPVVTNATSSGTIDFTGSSSGEVSANAINGTSSGEIGFSGASQASVVVSGLSSGQMAFTGASSASVGVIAASSGELPITGQSSGSVSVTAVSSGFIGFTGQSETSAEGGAFASGQIGFTGQSSAVVIVSAESSGLIDLTGQSTARALVSGASSGVLALSGESFAGVAVLAISQGEIDFSGNSVGSVVTSDVIANSQGNINFGGSAQATTLVSATSSGIIDFTGSATGEVEGGAAKKPLSGRSRRWRPIDWEKERRLAGLEPLEKPVDAVTQEIGPKVTPKKEYDTAALDALSESLNQTRQILRAQAQQIELQIAEAARVETLRLEREAKRKQQNDEAIVLLLTA